jgi:hypothetical protein
MVFSSQMVDRMLSKFKKSMIHEYLNSITPSSAPIPGNGAHGNSTKYTSAASASSGTYQNRSKLSQRGEEYAPLPSLPEQLPL